MTVLLIVACVALLVGAPLLLKQYQVPDEIEPATRVPVLTLEAPDGRMVTYTLPEVHEALEEYKLAREKLVDYLAERTDWGDDGTPQQRRRWGNAYARAVAYSAAIVSLEQALER